MSKRLRSSLPLNRPRLVPSLALALVLSSVAPAAGTPESPFTDAPDGPPLTELPEPVINNTFGFAVAADQGDLLVSAIGDFSQIDGVAYRLDGQTRALLTTYANPGPVDNFFGGALTFVGDHVAVAASEDSHDFPGQGAVYLFPRAGGTAVTYRSEEPGTHNLFGVAVATMGQHLLIGEVGADPDGVADAGKAYRYDTDGNQLAVFQKLTPVTGDGFGQAVAAVGDTVAVGAYRDGSSATQAGAVYLFDAAGNRLETVLNPSPLDFERFGSSLADVGGNLLVGAPLAIDGSGVRAGEAYLFDRGGSPCAFPFPTLTLATPGGGSHLDRFGQAVAAVGQKILVGAFWDDTGAADAGAVYVFEGDPCSADFGNHLQTLQKETPKLNDWFGWSLADAGGRPLIGAQFDDPVTDLHPGGVMDAGAAYLFGNTPASNEPVTAETTSDEGVPVEITFAAVSGGGSTTASETACSTSLPLCSPPVCLDISTTATFSGEVKICLDYGGTSCPIGALEGEADIRLFHDSGSGLEDITIRPQYPDTVAHVVCGMTTDFSLFAIVIANKITCEGFEAPLDQGPVTVRGRNRALPLKAELHDALGNPMTDADLGAPPLVQVTFAPAAGGEPTDISEEALSAGLGTDGIEFVFDDDRWRFNLKTGPYQAPGAYTVSMVSGDEAQYQLSPTCEAVFVID